MSFIRRISMGKLQDKVAVITGGVSGIGAATARLFAKEGAKLVLVDFNEEKGTSFVEELKSAGHDVKFVYADVTNEADVKNIYEQALSTFGKVDILFNNAGIGAVKLTEELSYAEWRKTVEVDLDAVFLVAQGAIKEFLKAGGGVMINTAS